MTIGGLLLVALGIAIGMVGIVVPMVPGTTLVVLSIGAWALVESTTKAWVVLGIVAALAVATTVVKYVWPAARMREAGVPTLSLVLGGAAAIVGFFVIPVVGLVIGFVLGIYLAEFLRRNSQKQAWGATVTAVKAVATSIGIEMVGAMVSAGIWLGAVLT
ncbi:hypothetical protein DE4585_04324 [Mycobacteroides salmoniphilum]|uniref:DUF456 domain-containing protein n=1 Tax=Mycobacteroides salmoniphilum TaxID=404941 RepID=A0A4R8SI48_9MYCO|nr:DUF456 domain-containing protein [Mycobacteroides salmoniphilum]TDZ76502.1 hypothetical protein DE4586_04409 [Mycobacteroides salmoniphilum]TDZ78487.1 hypothetical protein DE4585_04324 [Mycobacteroides salmoniphilum]TDZ85020.1 hypothetical protein DE4587_03947 [Mycobacteroides salmoniphilum]TDZ96580.1 hypothetical protein CCUG60885_02724 [Mycobacteroides salmoniphilum]TEA05675.1 hypothetical protein CCUG60883_02981 [Mycobacteroides salmoniphilum]